MNQKPSKDFQFFLDNVKELEKKYEGKYIVIKNCEVIGAYDERLIAFRSTIQQGHKPGTFTVQKASSDPASYTVTYVNSQYFRTV